VLLTERDSDALQLLNDDYDDDYNLHSVVYHHDACHDKAKASIK